MVRVWTLLIFQISCFVSAQTQLSDRDFEQVLDCSPHRLYLQGDLNQMRSMDSDHAYFTVRKKSESSTVPRQCIQFSMKSYAMDWIGLDKPDFHMARCETDSGFPVSNNYVPCLTEDYVNLTYNSFMDVTDCVGVPAKMVIPKIFDESGFHSNAFNPVRKKLGKGRWSTPLMQLPETRRGFMRGGDTGIGQLTGDGIADIKQNIIPWKNQILNSNRPSCQRIVKFVREIPGPEKIDSSLDQRCSLIKAPPNPVMNMLFSSILFKRMSQSVQDSWNKKDIGTYLNRAGFTSSVTERNKLKQIVTLLGYSVGPDTALIYFKNWLSYRIQESPMKPLSAADVIFKKETVPSLGTHKTLGQYLYSNQKEYVRDYLARLKNRAQTLDENVGKAVCTDNLYSSF